MRDDEPLSLSSLQTQDATTDMIVKALKIGQQLRNDLLEQFTQKVDGECSEFSKVFERSLQGENNSGPAVEQSKPIESN